MAYPIHPSQSDYDLMYSVLYDDFTAENAIKIIEELDFVVPFDPPPFVRFQVRVTYVTTEGGSLSGATSEWVWINENPANVPTPVDSPRYKFHHWEGVNGNIVDPTTVTVTGDTQFTAVFEYIPPASYNVTYLAGDHGHLTGQTVEAVIEGQTPAHVPTTVPDTQYEFDRWTDESGNTINPNVTVITQNRTFTAQFKYVQKKFQILAYSVKPRTTSTGNHGLTKNDYILTEGEAVYEGMFTQTNSGPIFDKNGQLMNSFNKVPTADTYYQRIDNTESLSVNSNYYRKTFYAGLGGKLVHNGSIVYSYTAQVSAWGGQSISTPTPQADDGWHFDRWVDLSDGSEATPDNNRYFTKKYAAIFVED